MQWAKGRQRRLIEEGWMELAPCLIPPKSWSRMKDEWGSTDRRKAQQAWLEIRQGEGNGVLCTRHFCFLTKGGCAQCSLILCFHFDMYPGHLECQGLPFPSINHITDRFKGVKLIASKVCLPTIYFPLFDSFICTGQALTCGLWRKAKS